MDPMCECEIRFRVALTKTRLGFGLPSKTVLAATLRKHTEIERLICSTSQSIQGVTIEVRCNRTPLEQ